MVHTETAELMDLAAFHGNCDTVRGLSESGSHLARYRQSCGGHLAHFLARGLALIEAILFGLMVELSGENSR